MVFNTLTFVTFFVVVRALYAVPSSWTVKKGLLLLASYLFYAAWNPPFVLLILFSTAVDFVLARKIAAAVTPTKRKALLLLSVSTNLGLLAYFKYSPLAIETTQLLLASAGIQWAPPIWNIILPVGISFYTFQTLSYSIDVYRGRLEPKESLLDFALFVTFFPQLVAGPIVRAVDFLPQLKQAPTTSGTQFGWALILITVGLFEKVVLGDGLFALAVMATYDQWTLVGGVDAWIGTLAFTGQIFCDFAGYSTIAIGVALCFGFVLPDNFHFPYGARGFSDFWKRWHISLSSWLRDYLYISLGGNRKGARRTQINLVLTMLLGGLWHGASLRFLVWGALHGLYLIVERQVVRAFGTSTWFHSVPAQLLGWVLTVLATAFAWVFFRAPTFEAAFTLIGKMVYLSPAKSLMDTQTRAAVLLVGLGLLVWQYIFRDQTLESMVQRVPRPLLILILAAMMFAILTAPGDARAFIYFQF